MGSGVAPVERAAGGAASAAGRGWAWTAVFGLLAVRLLTLPLLPLTDPTEGRYAEVCRQMAISGDWVTPRIWVEGDLVPFLGKPPLQFWMGALAIRLFGANEFAARLPSFLGGALTVAVLAALLARVSDRETALAAAVVTLSSVMFHALSGSVVLDVTLTLMVTGAVLAYLAFARESDPRRRRVWSLLVFVFLGGGCLAKGPVAVIMFGLPVLLWTVWLRQWRLLRHHAWVLGVAAFALLVVPWYALAEWHNPGFLRYFLLQENLLRYFIHDYGDRYGRGREFPYGTALVFMALATVPWTVAAVRCLWRQASPGRLLRREVDPATSLLLLGWVANTVFLGLARQLTMTYVLPCVPLFAGWLALSLRGRGPMPWRLLGWTGFAVAALGLVLPLTFLRCTAEEHSTRAVVRLALAHADELGLAEPIVLPGHIPYSSHFYAGERIAPHPREPLKATLQQALDNGRPTLCILKVDHLRPLSGAARARVTEIATAGEWALVLLNRSAGAP